MSKLLLACLLAAAPAFGQGQSQQGKPKVYSIQDDPSITPPKLVHKQEPKYTDAAKEAKAQGTVVIRMEVTEEGLPDNIVVMKGIHPDLDQNAVDAVANWQFQPAMKDGKPVRVKAVLEINFRLT